MNKMNVGVTIVTEMISISKKTKNLKTLQRKMRAERRVKDYK